VRDDGGNESFPYALTLIRCLGSNITDPGEGPYALAPFETRGGSITVGDMDAFSFRAIFGDSIRLSLQKTGGPGQGLVMDLFGPDCTLVASVAGATSSQLRIACPANQTGNYMVRIRDDGGNEIFTYALSLTQYPVLPLSSGNTQYLAIFQCTNHIFVRWQTNSPGFRLESNPAVDGPTWTPVMTAPTVIADHFYVDEGVMTNGTRFYRLHCPTCPPGTRP
jgi:hypothetical protein